jgi:hypothetical protein
MAKRVYQVEIIKTINDVEIEISPLKIKYFHDFMTVFSQLKKTKNDLDTISHLSECIRIAMKQFYPSIKTTEDVEDSFDLKTMYKIIEVATSVKMQSKEEAQEQQNIIKESDGDSWDYLELDKLESEIFVLGNWKNYDELESSMSLPEILLTVEKIRDLDYNEKRFLAAMQGVDLDEQTGGSPSRQKEIDPWEAMQARVASNGATSDPNDILSYQGQRAAKHGFGIGMGLDYENLS